jgi:hypothetical protein
MNMMKILRSMAIFLAPILSHVAAAATLPSAGDSTTVLVEASGVVPGFTSGQLNTYLAVRMREETPVPWQFSVPKQGAAPAPNRVVWAFKSLRVAWKPGAHKGFPSPTNSVTYLSAEVKLYLGDMYQMTMITQPTISGGPDDDALAEMVHNVAHALFVENNPER